MKRKSIMKKLFCVVLAVAVFAVSVPFTVLAADTDEVNFVILSDLHYFADASMGLVFGSVVTLIFTFCFYMARGVMSFKDFTNCIPEGFKAMVAGNGDDALTINNNDKIIVNGTEYTIASEDSTTDPTNSPINTNLPDHTRKRIANSSPNSIL